MRKSILIFLITLCFFCKEHRKYVNIKDEKVSLSNKMESFDTRNRKKLKHDSVGILEREKFKRYRINILHAILEKVLNADIFQKFLHTELAKRDTLFLIKNRYLKYKGNLDISVHGIKQIKGIGKKGTNKNYIKILDFNIENEKKVQIIIYYKIENVKIISTLYKEKNCWQIEKISSLEF